jgi:hypothetical protein
MTIRRDGVLGFARCGLYCGAGLIHVRALEHLTTTVPHRDDPGPGA